MRLIFLTAALIATACAKEEPAASPGGGVTTYSGGGRDRLCIRNQGDNFRAGVIVYAPGSNANCSIRGEYTFFDRMRPLIQIEGDSCRIEVTGNLDGTLTLGELHPSCAYYCGPGATLNDKSFTRSPKAEPVTDLAGDPLC